MATVLRIALSVLLFASMIASFPSVARAKLRPGIPYYMVPYNIQGIGGGVAPARVGNEYCPSTVVFAPEFERGTPVIFSIHLEGENVFIDEDTDVYIHFDHTFDGCTPETLGPWGRPFHLPPPNVTFIDTYGFGSEFLRYPFRIKKVDEFYDVTSYRAYRAYEGDLNIVLQTLNIKPVYDSEHHIKSRLTLTPESPDPILFSIYEVMAEDEGIKSVV